MFFFVFGIDYFINNLNLLTLQNMRQVYEVIIFLLGILFDIKNNINVGFLLN